MDGELCHVKTMARSSRGRAATEAIDQTNAYWRGRARQCPRCSTSFAAKFDRGQCPNCRHVFYASHPELGDTTWWIAEKEPDPPVPSRYTTDQPALNALRSDLDAAADFRSKNQVDLEGGALMYGVVHVMAHAVRVGASHERVRAEFEAQGGIAAIERLTHIIDDLLVKPAMPQRSSYGQLKIVELMHVTHIAWFLERFDLAAVLSAPAKEDRVGAIDRHGLMWGDYVFGTALAQAGMAYRPIPYLAKGSNKHSYVYMQLIGAITGTGDASAAIRAVDESFLQRNRDRRLHWIPWVDGDGRFPVKWHFRKDAILRLGKFRFGLDLGSASSAPPA